MSQNKDLRQVSSSIFVALILANGAILEAGYLNSSWYGLLIPIFPVTIISGIRFRRERNADK